MDVVTSVLSVERPVELHTPALPTATAASAVAVAPAITVTATTEKISSETGKAITTNIAPKKGVINPFSIMNSATASNTQSIFGSLTASPLVSTGSSTGFPTSTIPGGIFGLKSNGSPLVVGIPGIRAGAGIGSGTGIPIFGAQTGSASSFAQKGKLASGVGVNKSMTGSALPIEVVKEAEIGRKRTMDPSVEEILDFVDCENEQQQHGETDIDRYTETEDGGDVSHSSGIEATPIISSFSPSVPLNLNTATSGSSGFGTLLGTTPTFGFSNAGGDTGLKGPFSSFRSSTPTSATGSSFTAVKPFFLGTSTAAPVIWPQSTGNPAVKFGTLPLSSATPAVAVAPAPAVATVVPVTTVPNISNIDPGAIATTATIATATAGGFITSTSSLPSSSSSLPSVASSPLEVMKSNVNISLPDEPEQEKIDEIFACDPDWIVDSTYEIPLQAVVEAPVQAHMSVSTGAVVRKPKTKPAHLLAANAKYAPVSDNT